MGKEIYKIGISGSYGGLNAGDEAILQCILSQLRESIPVEITVFSRNPEDTLKRHKVERAIDVRKLSMNEIKPEIERLDLFVLGGGGILYDADARVYLREATIAKEMHVPVMLYAVGAGPLNDYSAQKQVREVLNGAEVVTVREREARKILESIGVNREITITADPALLLEPEPLPDGALSRERLENKRKLVGMSVREPGVAAPDLDEKVYHVLLANVADFMVDRLNADIVFIPLEHNALDLQHSHAVISQMLKPQRAWVLKDEYSSGQILSIMGRLDFAVGMRLHFLLFAALQNIPFVALPYASKVGGFLDDLDMRMPPIHLVNAGRLIAHIDYCWDIQDKLRKQIQDNLKAMKERARQTNNILLQTLNAIYA